MTLLVIAGMVAAMAVVALLWLKAEPARSATAVPKGFTDTLIAQVNKPTAMAVAPDGRLFVAQKANNNIGKLRVIKNNQLLDKPFLKVTTDTSYFQGLLGVTLDPNFSQNRYVYVFPTATWRCLAARRSSSTCRPSAPHLNTITTAEPCALVQTASYTSG